MIPPESASSIRLTSNSLSPSSAGSRTRRFQHSMASGILNIGRWLAGMLRVCASKLELQAGIEDIENVQAEQSRVLVATSYLLAATGSNGVLLILFEFRERIEWAGVLLGLPILSFYAYWVFGATKLFRAKRHAAYVRMSAFTLLGLGIAWGSFVNHLSFVAEVGQRNIVVAIILGLVSSPMLSSPFLAAMAFFLPMCVAAMIAVGYTMKLFDAPMMLCFASYLVFTFGGITFVNRTLLERSIGRVRLEQQNHTIALLLKDYEESAAEWFWETDDQLRLRVVSNRLAALLATPCDQVNGTMIDVLLGLNEPSHPHALEFSRLLNTHTAFRDRVFMVHVGGEQRWWRLTGRPILDDRARFKGYRGIGSDVTEARRLDERIHYLAKYDSLTGLANRSWFLDRINLAYEKKPECGPYRPDFILLLIDLDHFKEVNDTYGHIAGDALLSIVGQRLRMATRDDDVVARLGGDEFAILMLSCDVLEGIEVAKRVIAGLKDTIRLDEATVCVGASLGIVSSLDGESTPTDLFRHADLALYAAKARRGGYEVYEAWMSQAHDDQIALRADLLASLMNNQLRVEFQPIFLLPEKTVASVEALVRWDHPVRGHVPPAVFIPLAEESGFVSAIGEFVLREACAAANAWPDFVCIAVNISPKQFDSPSLVHMIKLALIDSCLDPRRLELELTEGTWLNSTPQTLAHLNDLADLGVKIVLDDFGTGYSSLSSLHKFRFDGIKMDCSFVHNLDQTDKSAAIVRMIARLADELGVPLTAEGIEKPEQLIKLKHFGIKRAQGYLLGRPMAKGAMACVALETAVRPRQVPSTS